MKINPNDPAMPADIYFNGDGNQAPEQIGSSTWRGTGLSIRAALAGMMPDTFRELEMATQATIHEYPPFYNVSENEMKTAFGSNEYAQWLAIGSAKWKIMQADALIAELNKEQSH